MAVHQRSAFNRVERERFCQEEWEKLPKERCAKLVGSFPRRLEAVIAAKGALTSEVKGLNTYVNWIFQSFICMWCVYTLQFFLPIPFCERKLVNNNYKIVIVIIIMTKTIGFQQLLCLDH